MFARLGDTVLLAGGRRSINIWDVSTGVVDRAYNVMEIHNRLATAAGLPRFLNATNWDDGQSTAYMSLLALPDGSGLIAYDMLCNGWRMSGCDGGGSVGPYGVGDDFVFTMFSE